MKLSASRALLVAGVILCAVLVLKGSSLLVPSGNWAPEGTMATARLGASAALLADGRILITGGDPGTGAIAAADFFNTDGTVSSAPAMGNARSGHISVTLKGGRVLVAGGITAGGSTTSTVEIFDPTTNSWTAMGVGMIEARTGATAALLSDGRVLIAGGQNGSTISSTIEVFDPALGAFTWAGMMSSPRTQHAVAALQDGRVLIVGGFNGSVPVASTDIFDPVTGMVSAGPNLSVARFGHSATTLLNGQVVVIGGNNGNANPAQMDTTPAEIVDFTAATPAFTTLATNLATAREGHLALLLPNNNNILIASGTSAGTPIASAELFMPQESLEGTWTYGFGITGALTTARSGPAGAANQLNVPSSTMQRNGVVMVAGGNDATGNALNTTEAYGYPTVQADQGDYPPGSLVTITGSGYQPNETITIQLVESPLIDTHGPYTVQADANGNFVDTSFTTDFHDNMVRFFLTATGGTSGFVAQNTFTDATPILSVTVVGPSGSGSVSSADSQITNCTAAVSPGHNCMHTYAANFSTTLTETSNSGFSFIGWSGGCTGTSTTCAASANGNNTFSATATFAANQAPTITSANSTTFTAGTAGSFTVTASGVPVPTFTETGTLPSGVTLTSAGLLSGTATVAGSFPITINASNGVLPNATQNFTLTVNPGAVSASASTVNANPNSVVADGSTTSTITVTLKDANNNPVSGKTVTLTAGSGSSTISVGSGASNASGVVTFTAKDTKAETVTYTAKDTTDNITITQTASVTFTPGPVSATKSTVTANPTSVTADGSTTSTITVTLLDANNNPVSSKTVTLSQGTGSSTISAASGTSNASGVVTFTVKDTKAESVTYTATDSTDSTTITQTASVTFTAGTVNATKSTATANPTSVTADGFTTSTITVTLLDANSNPVSGKTVTLTQGTGSSTISAASGASNASGVVTFTVKDTKAETVTYTAKDATDNITITQTAAVTFTPGAAAKLAFGQQPTNTAAGSSITPAVTVQVQDANGNAVTSGTGSTASIAVAIGTNPSGGTLSGTLTQTAVNGVATFSNLSINKTSTGYTLAASSSGLAAGTSNTFNITPGTATQLVFGTQPSNTAAGSAITPAVTVQVEDANNNVVTTSTTAVAMAIGTNPTGGTLSGTTSVNAVNGIATFSNLSVNKTGTGYTLAASSTGLTGATSNAFNITPGTASKLAFSQQPTNTQAGSSIAPTITVQIEDANNNLVTTSTASIAVAIGTNPGGGTLSGTLTQSAVNGVATFANLSINKTGTGYTLVANSTGLAGTTSNTFNITAGAASKLAFNVQPSTATAGQAISPAVTVQVQDANGNVVTTDASSVSITISSPGSFSGSSTTTVSASSGAATFSNLVLTVAGTFTLSASDGLLTSATSNSFTVNAGALAKFVIANIGSPQTAGVAFNVTVTAQDANGNTVISYNSDGNKANLTSTGALVGSPITTTSFTNGVVVQSVTITNTGSFTITATGTGQGNGIGGVPSNLFTVNPGPAASLTVSASASATAGTAFNFTVTAKDSLGNVATGYAGAVRFSSTDAQAVLPANSALTNGTGTFSATLKTAGTRTITGTDTVNGSIAGISGSITVSAGSATALVVSAPTSATAGTAFNFTVTAKDAFNNVATGYAGMVKFSSTDAQALLPANSALTNGAGTFSATLKTAGTQTIIATDTVTSSVTGSSGNITVSAGSAASISAFSGSGQSMSVGMAFANPLLALVQDGFGNPVSGVAVTFAAPNSGPSGTFNNSMTNIVAATDATGHAGTTFTANTVAGVYAVTASTSGVATSASFSLANLAGAITHLALTPPTATITAGGNQVYMAEGLDTYNNPAGDVTSATTFIIAPDGSCGTPNPGNSTCTATVADMNGSSHTVTGTYMNSATGSASLTVNAASPTQLVITSSAFAIIAGQCSANITATSQDQYGNASNVSSATQLNLSSASGTGKFYSDSSCQTPIPVSNGKISVNMAANSSTQTFAYEDTTPSPLPDSTTTITAADDATILTSGSQAETILQLVFTTSSFTVTQNTCSAQITLTAKNTKGTATKVTVASTPGLTSTSNGATFYSDNACAMAITPTGTPLASDATLGSGASAVNFSYEDSAAGNPTITATIGGYSVAQQEQIGTPPSVTSNPSGQAVTYGSNAMFTAAASGTPTPTVQWQASPDGTSWNNVGDGGVYSGATTTTLTLTVPPVSLTGTQYRAVFTNAVGSANSNAASLTVSPEPLMVSITGDPTKTYDAMTTATLTSANFSISGLVGTDKFTVTQITGMYASANAGSGITVTASLSASNFTPYGSTVANNYSFPASASGTGTISRKSVTASITASDKNYDGTNGATITSCTIPGKVGNDDVACSVPAGNATFASSNANPTPQTVTATGITLTGTAAGNYMLSSNTATTSAKINTAALIITASSGMMTFGGTPPMISAMYSGFVNGETPANLTAQPVCGTNATSASPVGSYMSSCSGAVDTNYTISYAPGVVTVTAASTMTTASSSENPSSYGQSLSFMATVTNTATLAAPTGSVQFVVDGSSFGLPVALSPSSNAGTATSGATTTLMAGSHTVTANYLNADGNFTNSNGTLSGGQTVNPATTSTALASATNPSVLGQAVAFTATVTDTSSNDTAVPTGGTVSFYDGTLLIGSATLNAGSATFTTALLSSASPHSITASFNGDANFSASMTSSAVSQTVNARPSTTAVILSPNTVVVGQASTVTVTVTDAATTGPSGLPGAFALIANSLNTPRTGQAEALLPNGTVLVVGGENSGGVLSSGEIYDPSAGAFTPTTSSLNTMRTGATATLLNNGTILVVGGSNDGIVTGALSSAEIFDPVAGTFTALTGTGHSLTVARFGHTATLLPNGKVLIVGGQNSSGPLNTIEVYDPSGQTFTAIGDMMSVARVGHAATLLMNGKILFTGGSGLASAEIYDPVAHTSTPLTASMTTDRTNHAAVLLPDGNVLIAGGMSAGSAVKSTELYNSAAGTFAATRNMQELRSGLTSTIFDSGQVLVVGGSNSTYPAVASAELYTPSFDPLGTAAVSSSDITDNITGACVLTLTGTGATTCQLADAPSEVGTNPHAIAATYSPSSDQVHSLSNNSSQSDGKNNLTVNKADTSTNVTSSLSPSTYGLAVTFTATLAVVSPGNGTPTGTVQFEDNGSPIRSPVSLPTGSASVTFATSALSAGTHAITAVYSGDSNFNSTGFDSGSTATAFSQTVNPAVLTVTANPQTKIYGQPDPTLTYTATGFQFSDTTATVLTGALARAPGETVAGSPYAITQGTVTANSNYTIHFTGSSLTITPATLTITANPQTKIYGQPDPTLTYTATGFQFSDTTATVLTGALARAPGETVAGSPYAITQGTLMANSNYTIHFTGSSLTITAAPLMITASSAPMIYGGPIPPIMPSYSGFVLGDTSANLATQPLCGTTATSTSSVGSYVSFCSGAVDNNYTISYVPGVVTVTAASTMTVASSSENPSSYGQSLSFMATVTNTATGAAPTGSVQFVVDGSNFGLPVALNLLSNTGTATSGATTTLMAGSHTVIANYLNADGNFANSNGALSGGQTVNPATTSTAVSSATNPSVLGQAVALTATVTNTSASDNAVPTGGIVNFYDGSMLIGSAPLNTGSATFTTAVLSSSASPHSITASFSGDTNFSASMISSAVSQTVNSRASTTALSVNPSTVVVGQASTVTVTVTDAATTGPSGTPGMFVLTAKSLNTSRTGQAATLLPNGTVLVLGGEDSNAHVLSSGEIYDPSTGTFTPTTNSLNTMRMGATATLLNNGTILIVGGSSDGTAAGALSSAEVFDPVAATFTALSGTGHSLTVARFGPTATLLPNGKVLIAGGQNGSGTLNTMEIYDPSGQTFTAIGDTLSVARAGHTATLLFNGTILFTGGSGLASAEIYDPKAHTSTLLTGSMTTDRTNHAAVLLPDGNVLVAGGIGSGAVNTTELYNTAASTFTAAGKMNTARAGLTATLLNSAQLLVVGGSNSGNAALASAELYTPSFDSLGTASVTSSDNTDNIAGTCTLTMTGTGTTTCQLTDTPSEVGTNPHTITGTYNPAPDQVHTPSNNSSQSDGKNNLTVNKADTSTSVTSSLSPSTYGLVVTFTATLAVVSPGNGTPTGTVQFEDNGSPIGSPVSLPTGSASVTFATSALSAGTHAITAVYSGDSNFNSTGFDSGSTATAFSQTVNPAVLTVTANPQTKIYGQPDPTLTYTATGFQFSDTTATVLTGALARAPGETVAGSPYAISQGTLTANSNYTIHFTGSSLTITPATLTITANPQTKVYGQPDPTLTYTATGFQFSDTAASVLTGALARAPGETVAGSPYAITQGTLMANSNYTIHFTGSSLTITPATLTITANPQTKVYGQPDPTLTYTATGFQFSDTAASVLTGALTRAPGETVAGSPYAITQGTLMANSNYTIHFTGSSLTITAAPLMITASSAPMIYGGPIPPIMPSYSGFVLGDTSANLATQPLCGTTATSTSSVGSYVSFCSGAVDNNYTISYAPGVVTVNQASTTTAVISSVDPSTYMQLVTLTATVLPQYSGTPTGTVTFQDTYNGNTITLGQATLSVANGQVIAIFSTANLQDTYPNTITAVYGGDSSGNGDGLGNFSASTSPAITQTVQPAANVSLNPLSLSFGNQNVNTTSKAAPVTLKNIGDATLNISANGISITGTNTSEFTQTNNCGASVAPAGFCTINVTFTPVDTGVATATLQIIDNDDDTSGAQQFVALTGAGLSTITNPGSLYTDAIFASANGCGALTFSGGSSVDSFSSVQGYGSSHNLSGGNVGTNGNVTLNGSNSAIYGTAAVDSMTTGSCGKSAMPGLTANGGAKVTGGLIPLNGPLTYPLPPAPNPTPPTTGQSVSGSCPSGMSGCTNNSGGKSVTLAPGAYGNVNASGGTAVHVGKGTYNLNSLTLSGKSILHVDSGPVVINLAGASLNGASPAMDLTGGSIENPSGVPENLQIMYAGSRGMNLSGGSASYATIYAPQALINMSGGTDFFGSIIGSTVTNSGGTTMHYDTGIPNIQAGNFIWFTAVVNNVNGLPSGPNAAQVKLYLTNASINFTSNGIPYNVPVPNAVITFNSASQTSGAKSSYDLMNARWSTSVAKTGLTGNTFVSGVAFPVPSNFPTGIQNVQFSAAYSTDTPGITLQWQWGAAVYTSFSTSYATNTNSNMLGVNPEDGSADTNGTDPAGTPEAYKVSLTFGATGGGLTNYTGFLSTGAGVVPTVAPMSASPSSVAFGAQGQGTTSTMMTAVLANNDSITHSFTGSGITIMGTNLGDFTLVPNGPGTPNNCYGTTNLTAGANCTLYVTFTPSDASTRTAKVVINDNANNSPQTVYLSGTGQ